MKYCTEFLSYIKILKLYNWEETFASTIYKERDEEVLRSVAYLKITTFITGMVWGMRYYVSIAMLVSMALWGYDFGPGPVFAGLSLIRTLVVSVNGIPDIINNFVQSTISMKRIEKFL